MRIDELKVDRSFIDRIPDDPDSVAIVGALISMARGLGIEIVAEGVEREKQREFLVRHACGWYQGFLISQPVPALQFTALLRSEYVPDAFADFDASA